MRHLSKLVASIQVSYSRTQSYIIEKLNQNLIFMSVHRIISNGFHNEKRDAHLPKIAQINLKDMILVSWGKLRRQYLIHYNPQYVKASLERRRGECIRCGTCCRLSVKCPFLDFNTQYPICDFYTFRSNVCRTFPIDAKDLKDRNRLSPGIQCGYWFES